MKVALLYLICFAFVSCNPSRPPIAAKTVDLGIGTVELPEGFKHTVDEGIDSVVGHFTSPDGKLEIMYDIGPMAGVYAKQPGLKGGVTSTSTTDGLTVLIVVTDRSPPDAIISFPDGGPTNFWAEIRGNDDIETVKKLAMTFKLKRREPNK